MLPHLAFRLAAMDKARFDRLYLKLFATIAGAIAVLTLGAYMVFSWSFERGFVDYLERTDQARLEAFAQRLGDMYAREGNWTAVAERDRWITLSREALGIPRPSERTAGSTARRDLPLTIDPRLMLFDAGRTQLAGRSEYAARALLKPIQAQGATVGYVGYIPRPEVIESLERIYLERQRVAFAGIAIGMLGAALALGAGLAYWITRRIRQLARGTDAMIHGDYDVRLPVNGSDELAQLARDFNTLAVTLAAARDARQQWIADIAHELRTPLSVLRGEIESLQDGVRPLDRAALDSLAAESARLARLVEDLHTLSLSDLGALSYYKEPADVSETVSDVLNAQRRAIEERGLTLELHTEAGAVVLADETRLEQVFGNLLQNSLRYTDAPGRLAVRVHRRAERVLIDWEDSAPGVPPHELPRLTERLYRVEASRNRASGGSGLGLAIARAIVEGHGGTLTAHASALGGLRIEIALPAHRTNGRERHG